MQLYNYFRSSASYRVRIALALKGLAYEYKAVHLNKNEQFKESYAAVSPARLVPLLKDGDAVLTQSLAIIEYLDETHPEPPLLPRDALGRARVRALAYDIACEIHPLNNLRVLRYLVHDLKLSDDDKNRWYRHWVETGLEAVERQLAHNPTRRTLLPRRRTDAGRRHAGAADLQCPALRLPARACADRDARVRGLHATRRVRADTAGEMPGCRLKAR